MVICACPADTSMDPAVCTAAARTGTGRWVYRVGIRVGIPGEYYPAAARGSPMYSEAGPGSPAGLEWVVHGAGRVSQGVRRRDGPWYHPAGPVAHPWAPCTRDLANAASGPIRARFRLILLKVSQTAKCHQNMTKRPPIVPISKTGTKSHLLNFLDFRFL